MDEVLAVDSSSVEILWVVACRAVVEEGYFSEVLVGEYPVDDFLADGDGVAVSIDACTVGVLLD